MGFLPKSFLLVMLALVSGCGGGGGRPYPPSVSINRMGLQKAPWTEDYADAVDISLPFPKYEERRDLRLRREQKYGSEHDGIYHAGKIFEFLLGGKTYLITSKGNNLYVYRDKSLVKRLPLPRYMLWAQLLTIELDGSEYAVVYVNQQTTSNTSTLLVLDDSLEIQYQEHLMGAEELGRGTSGKYGPFFYVKSKDYMMRDGVRQTVQGDWVYYLPHQSEPQSGSGK